MKPEISTVYLQECSSGSFVEALLFDAIEPKHLDDVDKLWGHLEGALEEEHEHWDWRGKMSDRVGLLSYRTFAIECAQQTQGLMIVNLAKRSKLPNELNKHLVYVDYIAAAPWNRPGMSSPRYRGVGVTLIKAAIQLSLDEGNCGRIGLHSLPQAEAFYRRTCGMIDLGPDEEYPDEPLRYFEMDENQADAFLRKK